MRIDEIHQGFARARSGEQRAPKWKFAELAERWKITPAELQALIRRFPGFPEATFRKSGNGTSARYYDLHQAQTWMAEIRKNLSSDIENSKDILNKEVNKQIR